MPPFDLSNQGQVTDPVTTQAKRASSWLDQFFAPVGQPLGAWAGGLSRRLGAPEGFTTGVQTAVEGLPRTFAEAAPSMIKGAPSWLKLAGLADVGLRSFADQPADKPLLNRLGASALETGGFVAAPKLGEQFAKPFDSYLARRAASALGTVGGFEATNLAASHVLGEDYNPLTPEHIGGTVASVLPWELGTAWLDYQKLHRAKDTTIKREAQPEPQAIPERITAAAYRTPQGVVETGPNHPKILERLGVKGFEIPESRNTPDFGFQTDQRPFVTREEAGPISTISGQALKTFEQNEPVHSNEVMNLGSGQPIAQEQQPVKIPINHKDLRDMEEAGQDPITILHAAESSAALGKRANESLFDFYLRAFIGADVDVASPKDENTLLRTTEGFFRWKFGDIMHLPPNEVDKLTKIGLRISAALGRTQGETNVLPASVYIQQGLLKGASFYQPSRSNLPNAFIGILGGRFSGDKEIFEQFHSLGHELYHGIVRQVQGNTFGSERITPEMRSAVLGLVDQTKDLTPEEMAQSIETTLKTMSSSAHAKMLAGREQFYSATPKGRQEFLADLMGLFAMGSAARSDSVAFNTIDDLLRYANSDFQGFARGLLKDFSIAISHLPEVAKKWLGWKDSTLARVHSLNQNMKKLMRSAAETDSIVEAFLKQQEIRDSRPWAPIETISFDKMEKAYAYAKGLPYDPESKALMKEISSVVLPRKDLGADVGLGERLQWWKYFIPVSQLAQMHPKLADMAFLGRQINGMSHELIDKAWSLIADPTTGKSGTMDLVKLAKEGTAINKVWSQLTLRQNALTGDRAGKTLRQAEVDQIPGYKDLDTKDRAIVDRFRDQLSHVSVFTAKKLYDHFRDRIGLTLAKGLMDRAPSLKWQDAQRLGKALAGLNLDSDLYALSPQDATEMFGDRTQMQKLLTDYMAQGPDEASAVAEMSKIFTHNKAGDAYPLGQSPIESKLMAYRQELMGNLTQDPTTQRWSLEGKPGYSPELRVGRYQLLWQENGKDPQWQTFKQKSVFDQRLAKLNQQKQRGELVYLKASDRTVKEDRYSGMSPERFNVFNDAIKTVAQAVIERLNPEHPELAQEISSDLLGDMQNERPILEMPQMRDRRLIGGRESLNMAESMVHWVSNVAHTIGKKYQQGQQSLYLKDPILRDDPALREDVKKYFDAMMNKTERFVAARMAIAANYIFFSPSLAFVELTQQGTNHIPAMVYRGAGVGQTLKMIKDANFDAANAYLKGKQTKLPYDIYKSEEETRVMRQAAEQGVVGGGVGWQQEAWDLQKDVDFINRRNFFGGSGEVIDRNSLLGNPLYYLYKLGANMHGIAIEQNTKVAFLSAYRMYRSRGLGEQEAFRQAEETTVESMHGGGKASRPLWYLGIGPGNPGSSIGSLMYSLQMYVYNTVAQMGRYVYGSIDQNLPVGDRANARRAASMMLAASVALAGVGGIPMSNQIIALLEQMDPQSEPRRAMREAFFGTGKWVNSKTHLMARDADFGNFLTTAATDGLMTAAGPWNMANRFELSTLMGVDPYRGFNWANVVGPGGQLLEQILLKPWQAFAQGDYGEGLIQAIPNSNIRRVAEMAHNGWDIRNKDHRLNVQLDDSEKALQTLGFTPKRVAEFRALDEMKRRSEHISALQQRDFHSQVAERVISGDYSGASLELMKHAASTPNYDPHQGARRVAELVQQKTLPYDPLRQGSRTSQSYAVGRLFDRADLLGQNRVTETDRLLRKSNITASLGLPTPPGRRELQVAQLVDQLMQANPRMTRSEALALLERVLRPRGSWYGGQPLTPLEESVGGF